MEAESLSVGSPAAAIRAEAEWAGGGGVTEDFAAADKGTAFIDAVFCRDGSAAVLSAVAPEILCDNTGLL